MVQLQIPKSFLSKKEVICHRKERIIKAETSEPAKDSGKWFVLLPMPNNRYVCNHNLHATQEHAYAETGRVYRQQTR